MSLVGSSTLAWVLEPTSDTPVQIGPPDDGIRPAPGMPQIDTRLQWLSEKDSYQLIPDLISIQWPRTVQAQDDSRGVLELPQTVFPPLPALIQQQEVVVGIVPPSEMLRLHLVTIDPLASLDGAGGPNATSGAQGILPTKGIENWGWWPVTHALGVSVTLYVIILHETWGFLGALEALDKQNEEYILRPIILWSKSSLGRS